MECGNTTYPRSSDALEARDGGNTPSHHETKILYSIYQYN